MGTLTGCAGGDEPPVLRGRNVVVVLVDTLRADHLGYQGYGRDTSPFVDSLAAESVAFTNASSSSSFTRESVASLLTGRLPSMSGSTGWYAAPSDELRGLGELWRDAGYRTGFFTATIMLQNERFSRGFGEVEHLVDTAGVSGASHALSERALAFVAEDPEAPFALYLHYLDPHGPYEPPRERLLAFTDAPLEDPVGLYTELRPAVPEYVREGFGPGEARYEDMVARYDAEIADVDDALRLLCAGLEEQGVLDDTLLVLTADHGEEFLEHGFVEHAWTLYRESTHVPLVFRAPGALAPARVDTPVSLVDLLPTLAALTGLPLDPARTDGRPLLDAAGLPVARARPIFGELLIKHRDVVRSVTHEGWKYVRATRWLQPERRSAIARQEGRLQEEVRDLEVDTWAPVVHEELYDLARDPDERNDLAAAEPERLARLSALLDAYEARCKARAAGQQGHADETAEDEATRAAMKDLGYY